MAKRIEYYIDDKFEKSTSVNAPARVEIQLKNGSIHERTVQFAKGTIQNPMTREELEDKFRELTKTILTKEHTKNIIDIVCELEGLDNLHELSALLTCH